MINKEGRNGGFSLVELIITVLILAIVSAALAPQVMKWVNNARISSDLQLKDSMESFAKYAVTDPMAYDEVSSNQIKITVNERGCMMTNTSSSDAFPHFAAAYASYMGKRETPDGNGYKISGVKLRTSGGEATIFVTRGAVSSVINQALASDDLQVSVSDVVVPDLWTTSVLSAQKTTGSVFTVQGGGSTSNPALLIHNNPKTETEGGYNYLDGILVLSAANDIYTTVSVDGGAPVYVYVGTWEKIVAGDYSDLVLYRWDGTMQAGNEVWKKLPMNGYSTPL